MKNISMISLDIDSNTAAGPVPIGDTLLAGCVIIQVLVFVETAFNGTPLLTIGLNSNPSEYENGDNIDPSEAGVYSQFSFKKMTVSSIINAYWNNTGVTEGRMKIVILYSEP
ncbi:MAG: hypothetical protein OEY34_00750 [Cyclobacteriaceae bacterium]|nr:hypothetical protein [Cyclobacteriaceae bacterium]